MICSKRELAFIIPKKKNHLSTIFIQVAEKYQLITASWKSYKCVRFISRFQMVRPRHMGIALRHAQKDENNNAVVGNDVLLYDTTNCIINMPAGKLVVLQGLDDYIIVEDSNALLICRKSDEQEIRRFVSDIKNKKGENFI